LISYIKILFVSFNTKNFVKLREMLQKVIEKSEKENSMKSQINIFILFYFCKIFRYLILSFVDFYVNLNFCMFNYILIFSNITI